MSERDSGVPEGRCGFELRPEDVGSERDLTAFREETEAVCCWRETWRNGRCLWHADTDEKPVDELVETAQNEPDRRLDGAIFRDVELKQRISFAGFTLTGARFENADQEGADFSDADLRFAEFPDADLRFAEFPDADLQRTDLTGTNLQGATITNTDLRGSTIEDINVSQATEFGRQTLAEQEADSVSDWDEIAQVHHTLKTILSEEHGLVGKAREHHIWEREARGKEALADGDRLGYAGSRLSRYVTGYGVDYRRVVAVMAVVFALPTLWYWQRAPGIEQSLYYSIVTFVTAPPIRL